LCVSCSQVSYFRCRDCSLAAPLCRACAIGTHRLNPLHVLEVSGKHFILTLEADMLPAVEGEPFSPDQSPRAWPSCSARTQFSLLSNESPWAHRFCCKWCPSCQCRFLWMPRSTRSVYTTPRDAMVAVHPDSSLNCHHYGSPAMLPCPKLAKLSATNRLLSLLSAHGRRSRFEITAGVFYI
jgi:hypothetical protein